DAVKKYGGCEQSLQRTIWATGRSTIQIDHPKIPDGYIHFSPSTSPGLKITIFIAYPGLGEYTLNWHSEVDTIDSAVAALTQGWPPSRRAVAKSLSWWPHHDRVTWPQDYEDPKVALRLFALHRLADLLGCLSLISHDRLLAGEISSYGAGHTEDLELIKRIYPTLHTI
ncbi:MAG: hypothetical protein WC400_02495, partial [Patescibacteria group bacterium]